jgi:hypothetical protein
VSVFLAVAGVLGLYALRGGTFDVVPRAELGIAAWWAIGLGWATGLLPCARLGGWALAPLAGLVALAAWTALSLTWTESAERTGGEIARLAHHIGFLALALSLVGPRTWRAAAAGAAAGALTVCAITVAARLWPAAFGGDVVAQTFHSARQSYPLNYWNAVAAWSAMAVTLGLVWSAHAQRLATRMLALAAVPVALLATYLTYSRAGVAGVALGVLVGLVASRHRAVLIAHAAAAAAGAALVIATVREHAAIADGRGGAGGGAVLLALLVAATLGAAVAALTWRLRGDVRWRLPRPAGRRLAATAIAAGVVVGAFVVPAQAPRAWEGFHSRTQAVASSDPAARLASLGGARSTVWASALAAYRVEPLRGTGAGTFEFWWSRDGRDPEFVMDAHSLYLEAMAELGIPGLLAVLAFAAGALAVCVRARRGAVTGADAGAAAACVAGVVVWLAHAGVDWMWESTATVALALVLVAAAAGARAGPGATVGPAARSLAVVLALIAIAVQLPPLVAATGLRVSQAAARAHDDARAFTAATDAAATLPWGASPHVQLGLLAEQRGDLADAEAQVRRAIELEPTNWRHPLLLARVLAEQGDARGAVEAFERAEVLRPRAAVFAPVRRASTRGP